MMLLSDLAMVAALCALLCALVLTKVIEVVAVRRGVLDTPNTRSSHVVPIPRLGGIAIVIAVVAGCAIAVRAVDWQLTAVAFGALLLAATGLRDDFNPLSAWAKYSPQVVAAVVATVAIEPRLFVDFPYADAYLRGIPAFVLSVIWITALTNAFNFMDGLDGLAAGVAVIAALVLATLLGSAATYILYPLAAALAGFLVWNIHPASIFMGDGGSQFIGFLLATTMLMGSERYVHTIPAIVIFIPFLFDTGLTITRRWRMGENVFAAHRTHLYQRLYIMGIGQRTVVTLYYAATVICVLVAIAYKGAGSSVQLLLILLGAGLLWAYGAAVTRLEGRETARGTKVTRPQRRHLQQERHEGGSIT